MQLSLLVFWGAIEVQQALHGLTQPFLCCRLMSNMVIYMTRIMGYEPAFASVQLMLFEGTCYLTPILGAWLADSAWGRFKTILVFSIIYFLVCSQCCPKCHAASTLWRCRLSSQWHALGSVCPCILRQMLIGISDGLIHLHQQRADRHVYSAPILDTMRRIKDVCRCIADPLS